MHEIRVMAVVRFMYNLGNAVDARDVNKTISHLAVLKCLYPNRHLEDHFPAFGEIFRKAWTLLQRRGVMLKRSGELGLRFFVPAPPEKPAIPPELADKGIHYLDIDGRPYRIVPVEFYREYANRVYTVHGTRSMPLQKQACVILKLAARELGVSVGEHTGEHTVSEK